MHPHLSDLASTVHRADLRVEGALWAEPSRRGAFVTAPRIAERWDALVRRLAARAERPRAGRSVGVCCPA
jgi:hypothetical protein